MLVIRSPAASVQLVLQQGSAHRPRGDLPCYATVSPQAPPRDLVLGSKHPIKKITRHHVPIRSCYLNGSSLSNQQHLSTSPLIICVPLLPQNNRRSDRGRKSQRESGQHTEGAGTVRRGRRVLSETPGYFSRAGRQGIRKRRHSLHTWIQTFLIEIRYRVFKPVSVSVAAGGRGQSSVQHRERVPCQGKAAAVGLHPGTGGPAAWRQGHSAESHWLLRVRVAEQ